MRDYSYEKFCTDLYKEHYDYLFRSCLKLLKKHGVYRSIAGDKFTKYEGSLVNSLEAEAEDVLQRVMHAAFSKLPTFRGECEFSTWLYKIAENHVKDLAKARSSRPPTEDVQADPTEQEKEQYLNPNDWTEDPFPIPSRLLYDDPEKILINCERKLKRWDRSLTDRENQILKLAVNEDLTYKEIANQMGIYESTVKNTIKRSKDKFHKA